MDARYILTNRHVVGAGPFWGHLVFDNHEEVDCYPVYRDPVHDFGILRYDPKAIKYMHVDGLELRPDLAKGKLWRENLVTRHADVHL
jgi:S1-C subfamily serine protease